MTDELTRLKELNKRLLKALTLIAELDDFRFTESQAHQAATVGNRANLLVAKATAKRAISEEAQP